MTLKILSCAAERLTQLDCCHRHTDRRVLRVVLSTPDSENERAKIRQQQEILVRNLHSKSTTAAKINKYVSIRKNVIHN